MCWKYDPRPKSPCAWCKEPSEVALEDTKGKMSGAIYIAIKKILLRLDIQGIRLARFVDAGRIT